MTGIAPKYRKLQRIYGTLCWIHTPDFLEDKITGNERDLTVTAKPEKSSRGAGNFWKSAGNLDIEMPEGGRDYASSFCFAVCSILSAPSMAPSNG